MMDGRGNRKRVEEAYPVKGMGDLGTKETIDGR